MPEPVFYPLEQDGLREDCQNFIEGHAMDGQAVDNRFTSILSGFEGPNEFDI